MNLGPACRDALEEIAAGAEPGEPALLATTALIALELVDYRPRFYLFGRPVLRVTRAGRAELRKGKT